MKLEKYEGVMDQIVLDEFPETVEELNELLKVNNSKTLTIYVENLEGIKKILDDVSTSFEMTETEVEIEELDQITLDLPLGVKCIFKRKDSHEYFTRTSKN